ncbi:YceI family protein [Kiloniella majae]|uniref:YceI family protein n=1 Tax=Kiloniella majae TaxID=1938558 RepID=UPI0013023F16|nr:YceI family protein [Kiloniella majae]
MLSFKVSSNFFVKQLFLFFFAYISSFPFATDAFSAPSWLLDQEASKLGFLAVQSGRDVEGFFEEYQASISFHPDDLTTSYIRVIVEIASLSTQSIDRDKVIKSAAFLDSVSYPKALFETSKIIKMGNDYQAVGTLNLHGITKKIILPFKAQVISNKLLASGVVSVSRLDFNIGSGQWLETNVVGDEVRIIFSIEGKSEQ